MLQFKNVIHCKSDKQQKIILKKIIDVLSERNYKIQVLDNKSVSFQHHNPYIFSIKGANSSLIAKGQFEIIEDSVFLYSFLPLKNIIIIALILVIAGIFYDFFAFFLLVFLVVTFFIEIKSLKANSKDLMRCLVDSLNENGF